MKLVLGILVALASFAVGVPTAAAQTPEELPWVVDIAGCTGSILSADVVATAAHCLEIWTFGIAEMTSLVVTAGQQPGLPPLAEYPRQRVGVIEISIHPNSAGNRSIDSDIALVKLRTPLTFNPRVQPIGLASPAEILAAPPGTAIISGRNLRTFDPAVSVNVPSTTVEMLPQRDCTAMVGSSTDGKLICAVPGDNPLYPCFGHSGGPIMVSIDGEYKQLGVYSSVGRDPDTPDVACSGVQKWANFAPDRVTMWVDEFLASPSDGVSVLSGVMFDDLDNDGTRDADEPARSGVAVDLLNVPYQEEAVVYATTQTASDGSYRFDDIPIGMYRVAPDLPEGMTTANSDLRASIDTSQEPFGWETRSRVVSIAGGDLEDFNFPLVPKSRVKISIYADVNGNGLRDAGEPLSVGGELDVSVEFSGPLGRFSAGKVGADGTLETELPRGAFLPLLQTDRVLVPARAGIDGNDFKPYSFVGPDYYSTGERFEVAGGGEVVEFAALEVVPVADGDADCSGTTELRDALAIARSAQNLALSNNLACADANVPDLVAGDIDLDGALDNADAAIILECLVGLTNELCETSWP